MYSCCVVVILIVPRIRVQQLFHVGSNDTGSNDFGIVTSHTMQCYWNTDKGTCNVRVQTRSSSGSIIIRSTSI